MWVVLLFMSPVKAAPQAAIGSMAPDFAVTSQDGKMIQLSNYKGRVVLLDFWATWCGGCKKEIPWYMQFQFEYGEQGLTAIGVSTDEEGWQKVKPFLATHAVNYPIVVANKQIASAYKISEMPVTLLIDRSGKIAAWHVAMVNKDAFEKQLQALLAQSN
jgi:cytochrome c biogenesis protein CcmG/thiol:disulfide interchange protein DsbE